MNTLLLIIIAEGAIIVFVFWRFLTLLSNLVSFTGGVLNNTAGINDQLDDFMNNQWPRIQDNLQTLNETECHLDPGKDVKNTARRNRAWESR